MKGCATFQDIRLLPRKPLAPKFIAIGLALRELREQHDISMGELAMMLGCHVARLSDLERGSITDPDFRLCDSCGPGTWRDCQACGGQGYVRREG